jgi:branched-chain amino acid transport system ATP-binding protein
MALLETIDLSVSYNEVPALRKVSIKAQKGEVVSVLGPNGAGKTTLLKSISGLVASESGSKVLLNGEEIQHLPPHKITRLGVIHVPKEGRYSQNSPCKKTLKLLLLLNWTRKGSPKHRESL